MLKNCRKKLLVILLIFTLTFSNFAIVGKAYATSILGSVFSSEEEGDTGSANVEFDAYFLDNEAKEQTKLKANVNDENLAIELKVKVSDSGYLKDAKILLGNGEELNFEVVADENEIDENVQSFEDNEVSLVQINAGTEIKFSFPIKYLNEKYKDSESISKVNQITFQGVYVNDNAEEIVVSKSVDLTLSWKDTREVKLDSQITKYISYSSESGTGLILQTLVSVDNTTDKNSLPVKSSKLEITAPVINSVKPSSVNVVATSTAGINGKQNDEVIFTKDNYSYDNDNNLLIISLKNEKELVSTQSEDEILKDETAPEKELYYSYSGKDEYLITYTYSNISMDNFNLTSNINEQYTLFGEDNKLEASEEFNYEVSEKIGDIATYSVESQTESVSKGYTYLNYNNEENKYEIEIDSKLIFNVSYNEIVENLYYEDAANYYVAKDNTVLPQTDIYYKSLIVSKTNFNDILGEDGYIKLFNQAGEEIYEINKGVQENDDGNYVVNLDSSLKYLKIQTSNPIADGNLIIRTTRAYSSVSYDKEQYKNFDKLTINTIGSVKYKYVDELAEAGNSEQTVKLEDTVTSAELEINKEQLSTLAMNSNVELKLKLNNETIKSDVYGNSEFLIKMPEYIQTVEILDSTMVYGEGLNLDSIQAFEQDGRIYLRINVSGMQNALSSGIVSQGTNIVLHVNIKIDLFAPAGEEKFELAYVNSEATSYKNTQNEIGYSETKIMYSAPSGVVSVNSISGYNDNAESVTSVKQGKQIGDLSIYSDKKEATMELTIMNNEENEISNVRILGRVPYQGVKDIVSGTDLGTTTTAKMLTGLVANAANGADFTIYYSENGDATDDLNDTSNAWTTNVTSFDNVKSYLIVPNDSNYTMSPSTKIRFTYTFEIPANLEHNVDIYGTFATYYTHVTDVATLNEVSIADLVGVSTGAGPQFELTTDLNKTEINEFESLEILTTVKNTGKVDAKNLVIEVPIPNYTSFEEYKCSNENIEFNNDDGKITYKLNTLKVNEELKVYTYVIADQVSITEDEKVSTSAYSQIYADDFEVSLKTEEQQVNITKAEMQLTIEKSEWITSTLTEGTEFSLKVTARNLGTKELNNAVIEIPIDKTFSVEEMYLIQYGKDESQIENGTLNKDTNTVTFNISKFDSILNNDGISRREFKIVLKADNLKENVTFGEFMISGTIKADNTKAYESNSVKVSVGRPLLVIKQSTTNTNTYVKEGSTIHYKFSITNEGSVAASSVVLTDKIPAGLTARSVTYDNSTHRVSTDSVVISTAIEAGKTLDVDIEAQADKLNGVQELSVTNSATINDELTSNEITHIIEAVDTGDIVDQEKSTGVASSSLNDASGNLSKTYKIAGIAWLDENSNGMRDDNEKLMKNISATLVNIDGGVIKQTTKTNSNGEYTFSGVSNGNYIIIFDYDTILYTVTTYQKEGVASNANSDVITTKIEQDGKLRNGAVTDTITIENGSISNIDIGLIEAQKFDLALNMGISKITVQNESGTDTTEYDNATLTKTEIGAKQMEGSVVYIEYTLNIKNEGEIAGYAKKLVDNIPEGMEFNSGINPDWYTGTDGKLYTSALSETEIQPGETKTVKLVLSKTMTNDNTGVVTNTAEIAEDYNIYAVSDSDSTPGNNSQAEDDFARADAMLSVRTGEVFVYISVIITTVLLIGIASFIVVLKVKTKHNKGGV